jgi:hypothetical protein
MSIAVINVPELKKFNAEQVKLSKLWRTLQAEVTMFRQIKFYEQ